MNFEESLEATSGERRYGKKELNLAIDIIRSEIIYSKEQLTQAKDNLNMVVSLGKPEILKSAQRIVDDLESEIKKREDSILEYQHKLDMIDGKIAG